MNRRMTDAGGPVTEALGIYEAPPKSARLWTTPSVNRVKRWRRSCQHLLNRRCGLPRTLRILDQCEAHVPFAHGSEPDAWRDGHQRLLQHQLREFERTHVPMLFG